MGGPLIRRFFGRSDRRLALPPRSASTGRARPIAKAPWLHLTYSASVTNGGRPANGST